MGKRLTVSLLLVLLAVPSGVWAGDRFAGRWKMTSMSLKVSIESWGENCGPQPKSYSSSQVRMVDVTEQGSHLIFSTGGVRTDRCASPNPKLHTVSESVSPGKWSRVCETSSDDPKYEKNDCTLASAGADRLDYRVKSRFDWTLKGDHCVAALDEHRTYERAEPSGAGEVKDEEPRPKAKPEPEPEPEPEPVQPGCEQPGAMVRLVVQPKDVRIGPGERICFRAMGVDGRGCRFPVPATWSAAQDGEDAGRLLTGNGCFSAGATAADSEGLYEVEARAETRRASAKVTVAYPDLGDLLAARLDPLQDVESPRPEAAGAAPAPAAAPVAPQPAPALPVAAPVVAPPESRGPLIALIAALAVLAAAGGVLVAVLLRRSRRSHAQREDEDDDWGEERTASGMVCVKCGAEYPAGARFCPLDGGTLAPAGASSQSAAPARGSESNVGMICPKCHRGYDGDACFCPHDSEKLVPYPEWRASNKNR
jgi:hypothetical protein